MTKDDALKQIEEAVKFLQENETAPIKPVEPYRAVDMPKDGKYYYWVNGLRGVNTKLWYAEQEDLELYEYGHVYLTREAATKARDKQLATMRVLRKLRELEGDYVADFSNARQHKSATYFDYRDNKFSINTAFLHQYLPKSWHSTKEAWQYVIDNMTDDLKLMYEID